MSGLIFAAGEETFWCPNMLSLVTVSVAGMTLNECAVLWIGTLTGGPVLLRCRSQKRPHLLKRTKEKKILTYLNFLEC